MADKRTLYRGAPGALTLPGKAGSASVPKRSTPVLTRRFS